MTLISETNPSNAQAYPESKTIALVAHDKKKPELLSWASRWEKKLRQLQIYATGTTGGLLRDLICLEVNCLKSGPLGGDQQIGALIAESKLDYLVFLWDPMSTQGHDNDVKALMRLAVVWNVPMACNLSSADFLISSVFLKSYRPKTYQPRSDDAVPELIAPEIATTEDILEPPIDNTPEIILPESPTPR